MSSHTHVDPFSTEVVPSDERTVVEEIPDNHSYLLARVLKTREIGELTYGMTDEDCYWATLNDEIAFLQSEYDLGDIFVTFRGAEYPEINDEELRTLVYRIIESKVFGELYAQGEVNLYSRMHARWLVQFLLDVNYMAYQDFTRRNKRRWSTRVWQNFHDAKCKLAMASRALDYVLSSYSEDEVQQ